MLKFFKRRRPSHRATPSFGYRFMKPAPDVCKPCVDLYGVEAVRATTPKLSVHDTLVARWHGLTPEQWADLSALAKVDHREAYSHAWGLAS